MMLVPSILEIIIINILGNQYVSKQLVIYYCNSIVFIKEVIYKIYYLREIF